MAETHRFDTLIVNNLNTKAITLPAGSVRNVDIAAGANIDPDKCVRRQRIAWSQALATSAADGTYILHKFDYDAVIESVEVLAQGANVGNATVTVDIKDDGTTILSAPVELDENDSALDIVTGTITSANVAAGSLLSMVVDATIGTGTLATGLTVFVTYRENPA